MYKDKEAQRKAVAEAVKRHRQGITGQGITSPIIRFDNGSYLHINKLIDPKWRGLLTYIVENLNPGYQSSIRVGMSGPSVKECKKLLEVTA